MLKKKIISFYLSKYVDKIKKKKRVIHQEKNSKFYIIASNKKRGFFSLLLFVLNHLNYSRKKKLVPIIDMQFHPTLYNEDKLLFGTYNAWEYFFDKINNYALHKIYKNHKFQICKDKNIFTKNNKFNNNLKNTYIRFIKVNKRILQKYNILKKKFFKNGDKIIGIHFRGTDMKFTPNHPLPMTKKQMFEVTKFLMKKYKIKKIFSVTEDIKNFDFVIKKFGKDNVYHINNFKSTKTKIFDLNYRKFHRYKMGEEALINGLCLSNCKVILSSQTGISNYAKFLNSKVHFYKIDNGFNSKRIIFSLFRFYFINLKFIILGNLNKINYKKF